MLEDWDSPLPILPLFPIFITWWLPWERWLLLKVSIKIQASLCCYLAFVAWHFKLHWGFILLSALVGLALSIKALKEIFYGKDSKDP